VKKLSLLLLAALALGGCKKNDDTTPTPAAPSKTDLLTAKKWRVSTVTATLGGATLPGVIEACSQDDFLKFNADKALVHDAGATKCDPSDPQTEQGKWEMPSESKLTVTLPASSNLPADGTFDIKELSATNLHLYMSDTQSGVTSTLDLTFTAL
jgi:hypothetical protein